MDIVNNNFSLSYITYFSFFTYSEEEKILHLNHIYPIYGFDASNPIVQDKIKRKNGLLDIINNLNLLVSLYPGDIALYLGYTINIKLKNNNVHEYSKIFYPYKGKVCWVDSTCIFKREVNLIIV